MKSKKPTAKKPFTHLGKEENVGPKKFATNGRQGKHLTGKLLLKKAMSKITSVN